MLDLVSDIEDDSEIRYISQYAVADPVVVAEVGPAQGRLRSPLYLMTPCGSCLLHTNSKVSPLSTEKDL